MNERLRHLVARREILRATSADLRAALSEDSTALGLRFRSADRLVAAARSGTARGLLVGAAALVMLARPRRVLSLALQVIGLWPLIAAVTPQVRRLFGGRDDGPGTSA